MKITKKFTAESSHWVKNATSQRCSHSIHGHSYTIEVEFSGKKLDRAGMLMDFGLMKGSIKSFIDSMDHCHVMCKYDDPDVIKFFKEHNDRYIVVPFNPTAEMLAVWIHAFCQYIIEHTMFMNGEDVNTLKVSSVTVHETATGRAQTEPEDVERLWNKLWMLDCLFSKGVVKDWDKDLKKILLEDPHSMIQNPKVKKQIDIPQFYNA